MNFTESPILNQSLIPSVLIQRMAQAVRFIVYTRAQDLKSLTVQLEAYNQNPITTSIKNTIKLGVSCA
jgi:hypothetical protein